MKWEVCVITPKDNSRKACRAFCVQQLAFKKPKKKEFGKDSEIEWFKLYYEGNHKQYLRISALVDKFNIDMKKITQGRVFKMGAKKWDEAYREWAIQKFYNNPATIRITEKPSAEDYALNERTIFQRARDFLGK